MRLYRLITNLQFVIVSLLDLRQTHQIEALEFTSNHTQTSNKINRKSLSNNWHFTVIKWRNSTMQSQSKSICQPSVNPCEMGSWWQCTVFKYVMHTLMQCSVSRLNCCWSNCHFCTQSHDSSWNFYSIENQHKLTPDSEFHWNNRFLFFVLIVCSTQYRGFYRALVRMLFGDSNKCACPLLIPAYICALSSMLYAFHTS